jgi:RNA polymerase sigma-70 factor (ECF subfamily)
MGRSLPERALKDTETHVIPEQSDDLELFYETVYARELKYVRSSLRRLGVTEADLPDVTQDVFVTVYRRLSTFDRSRPIRPWLFGVAFRVAADHLRLSRHKREVIPDVRVDTEDPTPGPDDALLGQQARAVARRALTLLDVRHRTVLVMHDLWDQPANEIAQALQIPLKTVYTRLRVARERFTAAAGRLLTVNETGM